MWSKKGSNLPSLKKLVIFNHRPIPEGLRKKFELWKQEDSFIDREIVIEIKQNLSKMMIKKKN